MANNDDQVRRRSVAMYDEEWEIVAQRARRLEGNWSMALRAIVREWAESQRDGVSQGVLSKNKV